LKERRHLEDEYNKNWKLEILKTQRCFAARRQSINIYRINVTFKNIERYT
jgi:hypothetical protein